MTTTLQLDAHFAAIQLDAVRQSVVLAYKPTVDHLVAEVHERRPDAVGREMLANLLRRYRAGVLELADAVAALRAQLGTDSGDLPDADDADVCADLARIRETANTSARPKQQPAGRFDSTAAAAADAALDALREGGGY